MYGHSSNFSSKFFNRGFLVSSLRIRLRILKGHYEWERIRRVTHIDLGHVYYSVVGTLIKYNILCQPEFGLSDKSSRVD